MENVNQTDRGETLTTIASNFEAVVADTASPSTVRPDAHEATRAADHTLSVNARVAIAVEAARHVSEEHPSMSHAQRVREVMRRTGVNSNAAALGLLALLSD
jgi:uncharacterized protein (UPF0147 family)